jgi:serine/threonine-protein kinase
VAGLAAAGGGLALLAGRDAVRRWVGWPAVPAQKHLVVLPFENLGGEAASQAFCDGLTEVLSSVLTEMEQFQGSLLVTPASEVRTHGIRSVREARQMFGVNLALTGSVQRRGTEVVLTANLVDARSERQIRSFVEQVKNVSLLQERVAGRVASMLELELKPQIRRSLEKSRTGAAEAYDLCMQAYGYLRRVALEDTERAIYLFQSAVEHDRDYALAYAGLGEAYWSKYRLTRDPQWLARAGEVCARAAELNDRLSAVHITMGLIQSGTGRHEKAAKEYERALELDPVNVEAVRHLAGSLQALGRPGDAEAAYRRAVALRPDYWAGYNALGSFYFAAGRLEEAERAYRSLIQVTPESYRGHLNLGAVYFRWGKYGEAEKMFRRSLELKPTDLAFSNLGTIYFYQGRYREALPMMKKATETGRGGRNAVIWGNLGETYVQNGDAEKARQAYERALELAEQQVAINARHPDLIASSALYAALLGRIGPALERIAEARRIAPGRTGVLLKAVRIYERAGRRTEALGALRAALKAGATPEDFEREPDLKRLRSDPHYTDAIDRHKRANTR